MKKILIFLILMCLPLYSQELFKIKESKLVVAPSSEEQHFMAPHWSPVADQIAFSSNNFRGIWLYDLMQNKLTQITDEISAGFGFSWSADGKMLLTRVSTYQQWRYLSAIKLFRLDPFTEIFLCDFKAGIPSVPQWTPDHSQVYFFNGKVIEYLQTNYQFENVLHSRYCYNLFDKIIIKDQSGVERKELQPFPKAEFLNLTLSPDGQNVAFEVYGGNCYIMNLETQALIDLGRVNYPQWSRDSQYIAFVLIEDDGYRYTSADIYISDLTGTIKQNITADIDRITMYPTWSPSGMQIAYSTYEEGTIEIIELEK